MTTSAREAIMQRIRVALHDVPAEEQPADVPVERGYLTESTAARAEIIDQFVEMTADYKAVVYTVTEAELPARIATSCAERALARLVVPPDLPADWRPADVTVIEDDSLSYSELEHVQGVLTGCALAIAQTGTIVLDSGPRQGRRALTLIPDYHLCVVYADQVVGIVPEAFAGLGETVRTTSRPFTFISGPSATSDIELNRVEGVHGPRTLEVIVVV